MRIARLTKGEKGLHSTVTDGSVQDPNVLMSSLLKGGGTPIVSHPISCMSENSSYIMCSHPLCENTLGK